MMPTMGMPGVAGAYGGGAYGGPSAFAPIAGKVQKGPGIRHFGLNRYRRLNVVAIILSLFVPWSLFCGVFALISFQYHYKLPVVCYLLLGILGAVLGAAWLVAVVKKVRSGHHDYEGNPIDAASAAVRQLKHQGDWTLFILTTSLAAFILALVLGMRNFSAHTQPFYDLQNLSVYTGVDPAQMRGQEMMDAGQVIYTPGTAIDVRKGMGFKNMNTYCVAPIAPEGGVPLSSYDFWAVGLNCCSGSASDFQCGDYQNSKARGGLRVMRDEDRSFYRLAVQQAQSAFNIRATHPLFFYWVSDPADVQSSYLKAAFRNFLLGMYTHFAVQLVLVILATCFLSGDISGAA